MSNAPSAKSPAASLPPDRFFFVPFCLIPAAIGQEPDTVIEKKAVEQKEPSKNGQLGQRRHGAGDAAALMDEIGRRQYPISKGGEAVKQAKNPPPALRGMIHTQRQHSRRHGQPAEKENRR